jgi:tetratricopeptide (TPR) repeat protein
VRRAGSLLPRAALAVALAAAGVAPSGRAAADPPLAGPDGEADLARRADAGPRTDEPDGVRAWARETAQEGRRRAGTALGGDLLTAAAGALLGAGLDPARALEWAREAVAAYPPGSSGAGAAWLHAANALGWLDDPAAVLDALARAEAEARRDVSASAGERERREAAEFRALLAETGPLHRARALTALGRHAEAADVYEALAARGARGGLQGAGRMWREAALSAWRAGDRERARAAGRRALEVAASDDEVVDRTLWSLLAAHGLLDEAGEVRLVNEWPGEAFAAEARTAARSVAGRRGAWRVALQAASLAMLSREHGEALALYETAFLEPSFADEARVSPFYRQTMVTAAHVALAADRPREALRWLQTAERWAGGPVPDTTLLRAQIDERLARAEAAAPGPPEEARTPAAEAAGPAAEGGRRRVAGAGLGPPAEGTAEGEGPEPARERTAGGEPGFSVTRAALAVAALLAVVGLVAFLTRRRRPPRGDDP